MLTPEQLCGVRCRVARQMFGVTHEKHAFFMANEGPMTHKKLCRDLSHELDMHLPNCPQCQEAHKVASSIVIQEGDLPLPCAQGLEIINRHIESCSVCRTYINDGIHQLAELLRIPREAGH